MHGIQQCTAPPAAEPKKDMHQTLQSRVQFQKGGKGGRKARLSAQLGLLGNPLATRTVPSMQAFWVPSVVARGWLAQSLQLLNPSSMDAKSHCRTFHPSVCNWALLCVPDSRYCCCLLPSHTSLTRPVPGRGGGGGHVAPCVTPCARPCSPPLPYAIRQQYLRGYSEGFIQRAFLSSAFVPFCPLF